MTVATWGKEEDKKYYELGLQKKIIYIPNFSYFLGALYLQTLKLPHEIRDPSVGQPSGQTEEDIENSVIRGVKMAYAISSPLRKAYRAEMKSRELVWEDYPNPRPATYDEACDMLSWLHDFLDEIDMLNTRVVTMDLPDIDGIYERDFLVDMDDDETAGAMPAPLPAADVKTVGKVEG